MSNENSFPETDLPTVTEYVWWSWNTKQKRWFRSCFKGDTIALAQEDRNSPSAVELDGYFNILVEERTVRTAIERQAARKEAP